MKSLDLDVFESLYSSPKTTGGQLVGFIRDSLGLGHVAFGIVRHPKAIIFGENFGYTTYSQEWIQTYARKQYWAIDPATTLSLVRAAAFDWSEAPASKKLDQFWATAAEFGITSQGFTIPMHGPEGELTIFSVSLARRIDSPSWWKKHRIRLIKELMPVASFVQKRAFADLKIDENPEGFMFLTEPKRQVLYWASQGKTAPETAVIMGISPRTVREHREGILRQLDCVSITQAAVKALQFGLIEGPIDNTL